MFLTALGSLKAGAWGWDHKLICYVAQNHCTPKTMEVIERYLDVPLHDVGLWMDNFRSRAWVKKDWSDSPEYTMTSLWHAVSVDENYYPLMKSNRPDGNGDGYGALVGCIEILKNYKELDDSTVVVNLKLINHLVGDIACPGHILHSFSKTEHEYIRWYDREDHTIFDVCADDHCQRYQGITKASNQTVVKAVQATRGQILMHGNTVCDARFSKCCGGATEEFGYCWEDKQFPYLSAIRDADKEENRPLPDLTKEDEAERWIRQAPASFCDTHDKKILSQILNNYDQETTNFYRWKVRYTQEELAELIRRNTRTDYGQIIDLIPVQRGKSGRICKLKIVGTKKTLTIGKELEIRRTLSDSHLFSSAFVVDRSELKDGIPEWFILTGAGWGHGVGLCQIGAAVMGEKGYTYDEILLHYYKDADIRRYY